MTADREPAPPASEDPGDRPERRSRRATPGGSPGGIGAVGRVAAAGWLAAAGWGAASFLVVALAGQLGALALGLWGIGGSLATSARIGWLTTCLFHHVPIQIAASASEVGGVEGPSAAGTLAAALLTGTAAAAAVLFVAGRRIADRTGGTAVERMLHGAKVAPVYALAAFVVSTMVELRVVVPVVGDVSIRPSPLESLAWPLALAAVAGAAGGRRSAIEVGAHGGGGRIAAAVMGGWRMLLLGLEFALAGLIVLAVAHPDATAAYARLVIRSGPADATAIVTVHALSLPNHAVFALVPAMGGCVGVYADGLRSDAICLDRFPREPSLELITPGSGPRPEIASAPRSFLFLLVIPAAATTLGGAAAVRRAHRGSDLERVGLGAGAGAAFAVLVAAASALAGIRVSGTLVGGEAGGWITYGPDPLRAGMLALGWGILGGGIGAMLAGRRHTPPVGGGARSG